MLSERIYVKVIILFSLLLVLFLCQNKTVNELFVGEYDARIFLGKKTSTHIENRVVVVDIDEKSLDKEGRWPWPRTRIALLLETLVGHYQVRMVGVDVLFPDTTKEDQDFYSRISGLPIFLSQAFHISKTIGDQSNLLLRGSLLNHVSLDLLSHQTLELPKATGYLAPNTPSFIDDWYGGHITPRIDTDGVIRKIAPLIQYENGYYEMLSLSMFRWLFQLDPEYKIKGQEGYKRADSFLINGPVSIPLDSEGLAYIPYHHAFNSNIEYISAHEVLSQKLDLDVLEGKIVILGSTATRLYDQISTPVSAIYPAVELHALMLSVFLDGESWMSVPEWEYISQMGMVALIFFLVFYGVHRNYKQSCVIWLLVVFVIYFTVAFWLWQYDMYVRIWPTFLALFLSLLIFVPAALYHSISQRKAVKALFGAYVPPAVVQLLLDNPGGVVGVTPEKREMSVLFADMKGFSSLAEQMAPEELSVYMRRVFDRMTAAVYENQGTVDKYMGDELMAFWGAPLYEGQHALYAVRAAIAMQKKMELLSKEFSREGLPPVRIGIGVNTGEMVVGDMGSSYRRSYTVIGDSVNQAERLQALTRKYKLGILIGETTARCIRTEDLDLRNLGSVVLQGQSKAVFIYSVSEKLG